MKKRKLKKITFDFKGAHLAYTDASQGGAASGYNTPYLLKSKIDKLTEAQKKILDLIGEHLTQLDKSLSDKKEIPDVGDSHLNSDTTGIESIAPEDPTVVSTISKTNDEGTQMSEQDALIKSLQEQISKMEFETSVEKHKNKLSQFKLEGGKSEEIAKHFASLPQESVETFYTILDFYKGVIATLESEKYELASQIEIAKSSVIETLEETIIKAAQEDTSTEVGHGTEVVKSAEKSEAEKRAEKVASFYEHHSKQLNKGNF